MRGLPSCGKTTRARELVAKGGTHIEFDEYFYSQSGSEPKRYEWSSSKLGAARAWNMHRIEEAVRRRDALIVLDDDNALGRTTRFAVELAIEAGYRVEFAEPTSAWWRGIRSLLEDREANREALDQWAQKLALLSRGTHGLSSSTFRRRMARWRNDLSIDQILEFNQNQAV